MAAREGQGIGGCVNLLSITQDREQLRKHIADYMKSHFSDYPGDDAARLLIDSAVNQLENPSHPAMWIASLKFLSEALGFHPSLRVMKAVQESKPIRIFRVPFKAKEGVA